MKLGFDPAKATGSLKKVFEDPIARTIWMAWRSGHIVAQGFNEKCLDIAAKLKLSGTITEEILANAMLKHFGLYTNDVIRWVPLALMFFRGVELRYVIAKEVFPCECHGWCDVNSHHRLLTGHHENCPNSPDPTKKAIDLIVELGRGMAKWAADAEGVHVEAWDAYRQARAFEGIILPEDPFEPEDPEDIFSVVDEDHNEERTEDDSD